MSESLSTPEILNYLLTTKPSRGHFGSPHPYFSFCTGGRERDILVDKEIPDPVHQSC